LTAPLITPTDDGFDAARMPWNVAVDQRPAAVVAARSADDVAAAVRHAREQGLRVMLQNTGHAASHRHDFSDVVLVRTNQLTDVAVDVEARTARVGAGVQWQAVAEAAAPHGLAGLAGSSGGVGTVGYSLGGGIGWLARAHGFAANRIVAADVVLADGSTKRVDDETDPDLIWALRGGGGSFAAVTALEIGLVPVTEIYGGTLFFPAERASEVLTAWRAWTDTVPETVTSTGRVINVPPFPEVPEPLRGKSFAIVQVVFLMGEADASDLLAPLRELGPAMDTFAVMPATELGTIHMDPPGPAPADLEGWLLTRFDADQIAAAVANSGPGSPFVGLQVRHMGGAMSRPAVHPGALDVVDEPFLLYAVGITPDAEAGKAVRGAFGALHDSLGGAISHRRAMNFAEHADPATLHPADSVSRLSQVRAKYDPDRVFVAAHDVG
jgi:FAD/FMN-containing dehydrogenase